MGKGRQKYMIPVGQRQVGGKNTDKGKGRKKKKKITSQKERK